MNNRNYIEPDKLNSFIKETWEIATSKGWHEAPISKQQYLGLIATEAAEAVEADRNGRRALTDRFREVLDKYAVANTDNRKVNSKVYQSWYIVTYDNCIKGSIEEEFADVIIRILDMTYELHGDKMNWIGYDPYGESYNNSNKFIETFWIFIKEILNCGTMNIADSISFVYAWAEHGNGITPEELDMHIRWKMQYNRLRPYKHGGKKLKEMLWRRKRLR